MTTTGNHRGDALRERLLPWLLVLPALVFAAPLSPLVDDPYPHLAGFGLDVVLLLPAAVLLLAVGTRLAGSWPFLLVWAFALVLARPLAPVTDTLEARRALLGLACAPLAFAGGAALGAAGRAQVSLALVLLSSAWTLPALIDGFSGSGSFAGALGDSGSLSQAALAGAAIGAAWLARAGPVRRALGAVALGLFLVHTAAAPVLAGAHSLFGALALTALLGRGACRGALAGLALLALLTPFVGLAVKSLSRESAPATPVQISVQVPVQVNGATGHPSGSLAGLGVRGRVWTAALGLVADHPLFGAGPGQFQAAFPVYRDPREIEISRHGVCSELDTEVEHAHNDWLQYFLELGLPGGALFVLGLGLAARSALGKLAVDERLPLAAAALALLVNAAVHAPLSANPASAPLAFALFGAICAADDATPHHRSAGRSRRAAFAAAFPLLCALPFAPGLVTHGTMLAEYVRSARRIEELAGRPDGEARRTALAAESARARATLLAASAAQPDSAPLLLLAARVAPPEQRAAAWEAVLRVRPNAVEALEQSGTDQALLGHYEEARARYGRALELSPTHPRILRNDARLELFLGDVERGLAIVERLRAQGCLDAGWLESLGFELILVEGSPERGARVLFGKPASELVPEELHASALAEERGSIPADALECLAQLLWGRQNMAEGRADLAVRSYRQAYDRSRAHRQGGAPAYVLEFAAAEARAGREDEARARIGNTRLEERTRAELPRWVTSALDALGPATDPRDGPDPGHDRPADSD